MKTIVSKMYSHLFYKRGDQHLISNCFREVGIVFETKHQNKLLELDILNLVFDAKSELFIVVLSIRDF